MVLKYPVSQTKNLKDKKYNKISLVVFLLEEIDVYKDSVNHRGQLGPIDLQNVQYKVTFPNIS